MRINLKLTRDIAVLVPLCFSETLQAKDQAFISSLNYIDDTSKAKNHEQPASSTTRLKVGKIYNRIIIESDSAFIGYKGPIGQAQIYNNQKEKVASLGLDAEMSQSRDGFVELQRGEYFIILQSYFPFPQAPWILSPPQFSSWKKQSEIIFTFFLTISFIILLSQVLIFLETRKLLFLNHLFLVVFNIAGTIAVYGFKSEILMPSSGMVLFWVTVMNLAALNFIVWVNIDSNLQFSKKTNNRFLTFGCLSFLVGLVAALQPNYIITQVLDLMIIICCSSCLYVIVLNFRRSTYNRLEYLVPYSVFFISAIMYALKDNGLIPYNPVTHYSLLFGVIVEALGFSITLTRLYSRSLSEISRTRSELHGDLETDHLYESEPNDRLQETTAAVLMLDLVGFTRACQQYGNIHAFNELIEIYGSARHIVRKHSGRFGKTNGDSFLAVFLGNNRCEAALAAGESLAKFGLERLKSKRPDEIAFSIRIGISQGTVVIGDLGNDEKQDINIIGSPVNYSKRLESACSPQKILVCPKTAASLNDKKFLVKKIETKESRKTGALEAAYEYNPCSQLNILERSQVAKIISETTSGGERFQERWQLTQGVVALTRNMQFQVANFSINGLLLCHDEEYLSPGIEMPITSLLVRDCPMDIYRSLPYSLRSIIRWSECYEGKYFHGIELVEDFNIRSLLFNKLMPYAKLSFELDDDEDQLPLAS